MSDKPARRSLASAVVADQSPSGGWSGRGNLPDPVLKLRDAEPTRKKPRDRTWEKGHRGITIRGIPLDLRQEIKDIADHLNASSDDAARAFLEYALECYKRGELQIEPTLDRGRRSLVIRWEERKNNPVPPNGKKQQKGAAWKQMTHYRLPAELIEDIKMICKKQVVVRGDLATYLLSYSLAAYKRGTLVLAAENK